MYRPDACYNAVCCSFLLLALVLSTVPDALLVPVGHVLELCAPYVFQFEQTGLYATLSVLAYPFSGVYQALAVVFASSLLLLACVGVPESAMAHMKTKR